MGSGFESLAPHQLDTRNHPAVARGTRLEKPPYLLHRGDALDAYPGWPAPTAIISDGAYGVRGFPGDTTGTDELADWYRPHVEAWSRLAAPATTLWFWNTEVGWATVHPLLVGHGWEYVQAITWDKGIGHVAGNVTGQTIRRFPVTTEICVFYQRRLEIPGPDGAMPVQPWVRHEWQRSGLPLARANDACGVRNAATRKYLTRDWLWYWPPGEMVASRTRSDHVAAGPTARRGAGQGHHAPGRASGLQPEQFVRSAPEPEAARVHAPHPQRRHRSWRRDLGTVRRVGVRVGRGRAGGPPPLRRGARSRLRRARGSTTH
jgi:hypothetical protein